MSLSDTLSYNLAAILALFVALWVVSLIRRDASIVDLFWGLGFVWISWLTWWNHQSTELVVMLLLAMVSVWGLRLSIYLAWRNWGKSEDYRYASMRSRHGPRFAVVSLFTVFALQAVLAWIISWPVQAGLRVVPGLGMLTYVGVVVWVVGLFFESVGDYQLARFKADPKNRGQLMNRGLWRYTRHPNYFGDFLVWWGIFLVSAESGNWWWTAIGPILMSVLLVRVSGVRLLESSLRERVHGYEQYLADTSAFFPRPPRRSGRS